MSQLFTEFDGFLSVNACHEINQKCENNKDVRVCNNSFEKQYRVKFTDLYLQRIITELFENKEELSGSFVLDSFLYVKYENGGSIPTHKDAYNCSATHTFIIYLNDDYENGETYIVDDDNITHYVNKKIGKIIIFEGKNKFHGCKKVIGVKKILVGKVYL